MLVCPKCKETLEKKDHHLACSSGHSFDISKEGYVNLLLSGRGVPGDVGDAKEMLQARRRFLARGHFDFLLTELTNEIEKIQDHHAQKSKFNLLDIGCGEGFYPGNLKSKLDGVSCSGMDVSKDALRMAAKAYRDCTFFLANVHHQIPIADRSITFISALFAPRNFAEFVRVLTPDGTCMIGIPTPNHLIELRGHLDLLKIDQDKNQRVVESAHGFKLERSEIIEHSARLDSDEVADLITMTPNFWHKHARELEGKMIPHPIQVTFSINCMYFRPETNL